MITHGCLKCALSLPRCISGTCRTATPWRPSQSLCLAPLAHGDPSGSTNPHRASGQRSFGTFNNADDAMAHTFCGFRSQMTPQQQAELHLTTAQGLATVYELFAKVSGTSIDGFEKEQVQRSLDNIPQEHPLKKMPWKCPKRQKWHLKIVIISCPALTMHLPESRRFRIKYKLENARRLICRRGWGGMPRKSG